MTGTMGLGLAAFVPVWTLMMAAMMLPSVTPTATLYAKTVQRNRAVRITGLVAGYLAVWAVAGLPAYGLARLTGWLGGTHPSAAHVLAVAVFAVCGIYQLSSLKDRCLAHCRSPLGLLLHYGSYQGRLRDLRVGAHHGGYCLGCCWALMVILIAVGVMNVAAMIGLAAVVLIEKVSPRGPAIGRPRRRCRAGSCGGHHLAPLARPRPARRTPDDDELIPPPTCPDAVTAAAKRVPGRHSSICTAWSARQTRQAGAIAARAACGRHLRVDHAARRECSGSCQCRRRFLSEPGRAGRCPCGRNA